MPKPALANIKAWATRAVIGLAAAIILLVLLATWAWNHRPSLAETGWSPPPAVDGPEDSVTVTWLGVTTLLFDDGETQILVDGFFSRPSLADIVFRVPVRSDAARINEVMDRYDMRRLAAIIPVHSHFDHAMDIGAIAKRSNASIIGSGSTAMIARGAGVPEDQVIVVEDGDEFGFGEFTVRLVESVHAPIGWNGSVPLAGTVDEPLSMPAPVTAFREGGSYTIVITHPLGTTLVQGSAGYGESRAGDLQADVVMLGTFGLDDLGRDYAEAYWQTFVTATGARRVFPIHFDDYTQPFGEVRPFPRLLDDFADTAELLEAIRSRWDADTRVYLPVFGEPVVLFAPPAPEA